MQSKRQTKAYRGHELQVEAWQQGTHAWSWTYLIDGKVAGGSATRAMLADADAALKRGMLAARLRADEIGVKK